MSVDEKLNDCPYKRVGFENFDDLYMSCNDKVLKKAREYAVNIEEAEDISQDVFMRVRRYLGTFIPLNRDNPAPYFNSWLSRIVVNVSINYNKKNYKQKEVVISNGSDYTQNFLENVWDEKINLEEQYATQETQDVIDLFIDKSLKDSFKSVFVLRTYHNLEYSEIAKQLNIPIGTVMSRLHRARKILKERVSSLEDYL